MIATDARKATGGTRRRRGFTLVELLVVIARYNTQSTLERDVKPGNNTLDFELTTQE